MMAYSYWMCERKREGSCWIAVVRWDLATCYVLSGLFGIAIICLVGGISQEDFARIAGINGNNVVEQPKIQQVFFVVSYTGFVMSSVLGRLLEQ